MAYIYVGNYLVFCYGNVYSYPKLILHGIHTKLSLSQSFKTICRNFGNNLSKVLNSMEPTTSTVHIISKIFVIFDYFAFVLTDYVTPKITLLNLYFCLSRNIFWTVLDITKYFVETLFLNDFNNSSFFYNLHFFLDSTIFENMFYQI